MGCKRIPGIINEDKSPTEMQWVNDLWTLGDKGLAKIVTSCFTIAEVIYKKGVSKLDPAHRPTVGNFFLRPFIVQKPVTREIAELARDVVWDYAIKPQDAVHVATAAYFQIPELHTFDGGLLKHRQLVINGYTLLICVPHGFSQGEMNV